ncbi:MAG: T9SS type A sorting domain-containing protein [Bacteroidales bacterium]|nr:T9SS type A sorting domain-containing protein [Bacteroidales bacterium]
MNATLHLFDVSDAEARIGLKSARFMKKAKDAALTGGSYCGYRTQFSNYNDAIFSYNEHAWIGFSVYVAEHQLTDKWSADNVWVFQFKNIDAGGGGNQYGSIKSYKNGGTYYWNVEGLGDIGAIEINKWTDFVVHVYYSTSSNGKVEVWRNGTKYTYNGALPAKQECYLTFGIYSDMMDAADPANKLYFDEIRYLDDASSTDHYNTVRPAAGTSANMIKANDVIWLKSKISNQYVCADQNLGTEAPLFANRSTYGAWEKFEVKDAGDGWFRLWSVGTSKYVMSNQDNSSKLQANASAGSWEKMKFYYTSDGYVGMKYQINGKFVAAENYGTEQLIADRTSVGDWEKFSWGLTTKSAELDEAEAGYNNATVVYPNPLVSGSLIIGFTSPVTHKVEITNLQGQRIYNTEVTEQQSLTINKEVFPSKGIYLVKVDGENGSKTEMINVR